MTKETEVITKPLSITRGIAIIFASSQNFDPFQFILKTKMQRTKPTFRNLSSFFLQQYFVRTANFHETLSHLKF